MPWGGQRSRWIPKPANFIVAITLGRMVTTVAERLFHRLLKRTRIKSKASKPVVKNRILP